MVEEDPRRYDPARDEQYEVRVIACRRAEPPADLELRKLWNDLAPLDPGWTEGQCTVCGAEIRIGVRQNAYLLTHPDVEVLIACLECAGALSRINPHGAPIRHLGGR